mgnify:CR=1 FL=1
MKTRILSGIVLIVVMLSLVYLGGIPMAVIFGICSIIGFLELTNAMRVDSDDSNNPLSQKRETCILDLLGIAGTIYIYIVQYFFGDGNKVLFGIVALLVLFLMIYVFTYPRYSTDKILKTFFSFVYASVIFSYFFATRNFSGQFDTEHFNTGFYAVIMILISSWGSDTFAYFTGVSIGKHKIFPILSPKKSLEGCIGGVIGSGILGALYGLLLNKMGVCASKFILYFGILCMAGSIVGQVGDLAASGIKRNYKIKDYGKLIPGHGGIMDRFDSVILISPFVYCICDLFLK